MEYDFRQIEARWKQYWNEQQVYKVSNDTGKPKCYVLDMFPYPSGAGLHVGHPLGYIASDIYARYKRLKGFNVLHPMGFDAFGLPAEQYAIETGQHPAVTTEKNIARYREQLDNIGFCYDWSREVRTSDPKYYKWTQWIFLQLFHSWYDAEQDRARPIAELISIFEQGGNARIGSEKEGAAFSAAQWAAYGKDKKREILMQYRLAYQGYAQVWWCEALGTVLANDEVVNGVSERGGFPVERKNMRQWFLRITAYANRLLSGLDTLDWSEAMKEMQRNWIGRSSGAVVKFELEGAKGAIEVFTTRPDTIFGADFIVLAPEHMLVNAITAPGRYDEIENYKKYVKSRSERERMAEVKTVTGCFTGAYALHPLTGRQLPVWISEYVLAGYGTGAIMAVPAGDDRDHAFAKHFNIPVTNIFGEKYTGEQACSDKTGVIQNSGFLTGMSIPDATEAAIDALVKAGAGIRKVNYRLRDAGFSRQRYWGEPFPIIYVNGVPYGTDELPEGTDPGLNVLPVELPMVEHYKAGPEGQGPLANVADWVTTQAGERETNTMPGYAGSSWYFLRYMDPHNDTEFAGRAATDYWQQVDLYIGGTEHAVGHLLYARMWTKALYDLGHIGFDEPFKKLLNQGMIQGSSRFVHDIKRDIIYRGAFDFPLQSVYISKDILDKVGSDTETRKYVEDFIDEHTLNYQPDSNKSGEFVIGKSRVDVNLVTGLELDIEAFKKWRPENANAKFYTNEEGKFICSSEVEKMSKSKYNVVNPDDIVVQYGADTFRMYEMFLGPIDVSKPWDTKGIEGVHRFLKKLWRLYNDEGGWRVSDDAPAEASLRVLHKAVKKIGEDIERFSFNTAVSAFMIMVNDLTALNCHSRAVLEPLTILITPFAPHIAEELWHGMGEVGTVLDSPFPEYQQQYVSDNTKKYPVAVNGKTRAEMEFELDAPAEDIEKAVLAEEGIAKWMEGRPMKKFIYVKGKMINVVV